MCALACQSAEQLCTASVFDKRARAVKKTSKKWKSITLCLWFINKNLAFYSAKNIQKAYQKSVPTGCTGCLLTWSSLWFLFFAWLNTFPFELVSTHLSLKHVCVYGDDQLSADTGARVPATCMKINGDVQCLVIHHHHHHHHHGQRL